MSSKPTPKLLILAYKAPPVHTPGCLRLYHLVRQLQRYFTAIHLQQSDIGDAFRQDEMLRLPAEIIVNTIAAPDLRSRMLEKGGTISAKRKQKKSFRLLASMYHAFPFVYFTGDGGRTYINDSIKQASRLIEQEGITHLFSSFRPWADHIIASRLKKKFPHLVWIADFRDLAVDRIRKDIWWPALQYQFEKRILRKADVVTTVSEGLARHFRKNHTRVVVLRNGLANPPTGFMTAPASERFTITYTGSLYPTLQSAGLLFSTLRQMLDNRELNPYHLELHYAGKDDEVWEEWLQAYSLNHYSVNHQMLSLAEAENLQHNSQINLLLSWSAQDYGGIMTSKLGSYLAASRPIICLLNGPADPEWTQLMEQTNSGFVYPLSKAESAEQLHHFLLDAYRTWQFSGALPWRSDSQQLQAYTWQTQVENLTEVIFNK